MGIDITNLQTFSGQGGQAGTRTIFQPLRTCLVFIAAFNLALADPSAIGLDGAMWVSGRPIFPTLFCIKEVLTFVTDSRLLRGKAVNPAPCFGTCSGHFFVTYMPNAFEQKQFCAPSQAKSSPQI